MDSTEYATLLLQTYEEALKIVKSKPALFSKKELARIQTLPTEVKDKKTFLEL